MNITTPGADPFAMNVNENVTGTIYTAAVTDTDANDTVTWSISGGADAAKFTINASTGALSFVSAPNREPAGTPTPTTSTTSSSRRPTPAA